MLNADQLEHAIAIQKRCFKLLQWLGKAVQAGFVTVTRAHHVADTSLAAKEWVETHLYNLPEDCRPSDDDIGPFANFFSTYLETSFDLVAHPRKEYESSCGCFCQFCCRMVNPRHLKPKSLTREDKDRATKLRVRRMEMLAREEGLPSFELSIRASLDDEVVRRHASFGAYGAALLDRLKGISSGPAVLSLWRDFAWNPNGSPNPTFRLKLKRIQEAEGALLRIVRQHAIH